MEHTFTISTDAYFYIVLYRAGAPMMEADGMRRFKTADDAITFLERYYNASQREGMTVAKVTPTAAM